MTCKDQLFGHNFIGSGKNAYCTECSVNQQKMSYPKPTQPKEDHTINKPVRGADRPESALAIEIVTTLKDKKKGAVGEWIGRIKQKGFQTVFEAFQATKKTPDLKNPAAYMNGILKNK